MELQLNIRDFIVNCEYVFFLNVYLFHSAGLKQSGVYVDSCVATEARMMSLFAFLLFI